MVRRTQDPPPDPSKPPRRERMPKNRHALPERAPDAPPIPDFTPVPRVFQRHDGWTPERQKAFIGALADTGCVDRAANMVNMAQSGCYTLRRAPGAEEFRRAWDAALDFGLARLKDIAFERAIEGELIPVFAGGKLVGHRRKRNDALLMFCLRHYGQDAKGKRTTINYFSTRASASSDAAAGEGAGGAAQAAGAEASTTTVRTVITGNGPEGADIAEREAGAIGVIESFEGVPLDDAAKEEIRRVMLDCAARYRQDVEDVSAGGDRAADAQAGDPSVPFVEQFDNALPWRGTLENPWPMESRESTPGECSWEVFGGPLPAWAQDLDYDV